VSTLRNRRIVVARDPSRAAALVDRIEEAGGRAHSFALTQSVEPRDGGALLSAAADRIEAFEWVLFTSARGVRALDDYPALTRAARFGVVGPTTARELENRGCRAELVGTGAGGAELAGLLIALYPDSGPLLFIGAEAPAGGLVERLREAGMVVEHVANYATVPRSLGIEETQSLAEADIVVLAAPSAVLALLDYSLKPSLVLVASGPTTARAAQDAGFLVVEASSPDIDAVFLALETAVETLG